MRVSCQATGGDERDSVALGDDDVPPVDELEEMELASASDALLQAEAGNSGDESDDDDEGVYACMLYM